jgi:hypothetical protein
MNTVINTAIPRKTLHDALDHALDLRVQGVAVDVMIQVNTDRVTVEDYTDRSAAPSAGGEPATASALAQDGEDRDSLQMTFGEIKSFEPTAGFAEHLAEMAKRQNAHVAFTVTIDGRPSQPDFDDEMAK